LPLRAVETTRLYRQIADQIVGLIDSGEFPAGSRLPPERELAALLGVSRTSVREAIIALEISGRVEVRVGTGIFVTRPPAHTAPAPRAEVGDSGVGPFELLAARAVIEGETAALAAKHARKADLVALRAKTLADHEAIVAALAVRDPDGARKAMHRHLERVVREFQRRWDETPATRVGIPK